MWIRSLEWRSATGEGNLRAETPSDADGLPEGVLDATDVEATLKHVATVAGDRAGEWTLELVAAAEDDRGTLASLLDPLTGSDGDDLATYLVADDAPTSAGTYTIDVDGNIERERGYLSGHLCQLLRPVEGDDAPLLYVTRVRVVADKGFVVVNWMAPGGFPAALTEPRVEANLNSKRRATTASLRWPMNVDPIGPADLAREAGIAPEVIRFERGPHEGALDRFGPLQGSFGATPSAPQLLAEGLVARLASALGFTAQRCGEALQAWEGKFLQSTVEQDPAVPITTPDSYRRLARIANIIGAVGSWTQTLNSPSSSEPLYWFAHSPDSEEAMQSLESASRRLDAAREDYRTALTIAAGIATSQQLELQSATQAQGQAFERTVALAGSIVLVPGVVATFYGANVPLPAGETWAGTVLVATLMLLAGSATWIALTDREAPRRWIQKIRRRHQ